MEGWNLTSKLSSIIRRLKLDSDDSQLMRNLWQCRKNKDFVIQYRTRADGVESQIRQGRSEPINYGFYLNVSDVPERAFVEVEGVLGGAVQFNSGWVSADAVQVKIQYEERYVAWIQRSAMGKIRRRRLVELGSVDRGIGRCVGSG
jgi:hypothetical protein